jgi:hypothetical protein
MHFFFQNVSGSSPIGMVLAESSTMQNRTFFRQHLCSELVSVARLSRRGAKQALEGNLEEIGEWSALILAQDALPVGANVRVRGKTHELKGFVRSCTFDRMLGFFIDIGLEAESRWSEKWFVPQHLFRLCPSLRGITEKTSNATEEFLLAKPAHI